MLLPENLAELRATVSVNKTENEFQSMTASQGNQGLFFLDSIKAFYTVS